jgi:predicted dehydrogenase
VSVAAEAPRLLGSTLSVGAREVPPDPPGVGVVGFGSIASNEHLAAYRRLGIDVVAVHDPSPAAAGRARAEGLVTVDSLDALLADPAVAAVDVATPVEVRPEIVARALAAGKHVLAQKPFALDVDVARDLVLQAERAGLVLAVNVNARWSAGWRACTRLLADGSVGTVRAVTHVVELDLGFQAGGPLDSAPHFAIVDVLTHWIDISGVWLDWSWPVRVQAEEHRLPEQPVGSNSPFGATVSVVTAAGAAVAIHLIGANALPEPRWKAWVHGVGGTIRTTSRWGGPDEITLEQGADTSTATFAHGWVPEGFDGAIADFIHAAATGEPAEHAARTHLPMLAVTLAAVRSASAGGIPVMVEDPC